MVWADDNGGDHLFLAAVRQNEEPFQDETMRVPRKSVRELGARFFRFGKPGPVVPCLLDRDDRGGRMGADVVWVVTAALPLAVQGIEHDLRGIHRAGQVDVELNRLAGVTHPLDDAHAEEPASLGPHRGRAGFLDNIE